jgi:alginate O-acetyltransferase complex protein AlgI
LKLMAWGMFKKVVIADRLAIAVNLIYGNPTYYSGIHLIVTTLFFSFQIYCDFSGYSDIAIGSARVMGFRLMNNFDRPYFSQSIAEFWKRWHISLSSWFRDYLYISLGGNRATYSRWLANLFITFLISGFWHGASWTYVLWGALNGFYLLFSIVTKRMRETLVHTIRLDRAPTLHKCLRICFTFFFISFAWIVFRAKNMPDVWYVVTHMFQGIGTLSLKMLGGNSELAIKLGLTGGQLWIAIASLVFLILVDSAKGHNKIRRVFSGGPAWVRWSFYYCLVMGIVVFGVFRNEQFIYFQF